MKLRTARGAQGSIVRSAALPNLALWIRMGGALLSVQHYVSRLPRGADSYPECSVKASLLQNATASCPLGPEVELPPAVRALVDHPPPVSIWIPEVHFNVAMLAIFDTYFSRGSPGGFQEWVYSQNRKLFQTALYRAMFWVLSPPDLLHGLEKRWHSFRRGSELRCVKRSARDSELRLTVPPALYDTTSVMGLGAALRAGIDSAGARCSQVLGELVSPTEVVYRLSWQ